MYLHAVLRFLDGVMQQTLDATLKRPALLHKRLVTADTPTVSHTDVAHCFANRTSVFVHKMYLCLRHSSEDDVINV